MITKTDKEIVAVILRAQGITAEPTPEAVRAYKVYADMVWSEATRSAEFDAAMASSSHQGCC
jgi:hypothetical protein